MSSFSFVTQRKTGSRRAILYSILLLFVIFSGSVMLSSVLVSNPNPAKPIRLVAGEWEPFIGPNMIENGPVARIVTETFLRMGYEPEITYTSWEIAENQINRIEVLGAFPFIASERRLNDYYVTDSIFEFDYVLFYYRENVPNVNDLQTLADFEENGYIFGKVAGYDVWSGLEDANFEREYPTSEAAFQALAEGEIHFLPEGRLVGEVILNSSDILEDALAFGSLDASDSPILGATETLHLLLPKNETARELRDQFNQELRNVRSSLVYEEARTELNQADSAPIMVEILPLSEPSPVVNLDGEIYQLPHGTHAIVTDRDAWTVAFLQPITTTEQETAMIEVKLLNGPLQGRVVTVSARAIRLMD